MKKIIEVEIGFPKSIVQYEGEPTSKLVSTEKLQEELNLQLQQERSYSEEEVLQIIKNAFSQGERYGWDTQSSIGNIDEMKSKIPFISLEKYLETFNK